MSKKLTTEEFIKRAKRAHGDKYDYSLVNYKTSKEKVDIICKKHGIFSQIPNNHLNGCNCKHCGVENTKSKQILGRDLFIKKAKDIHGNEYDYSAVEYKNSKTKVKIICEKHGAFEQAPADHLRGKGCIKCSHISTGKAKIKTFENFVEKAIETHKEGIN